MTSSPVDELPEPLSGPTFGSYAPDEVRWLLKDLSTVDLEEEAESREGPIQRGERHYAESLPVEYRPTARYRDLFDSQLAAGAPRVAEAVGVVTELLLRERGPDLVLASLARAGTPVGILVRRWAAHFHGLEWPHLTLSIVRGRGVDLNALRWLAGRFDPARVVFIDGWTGKGAIAEELEHAVTAANIQLALSPGRRFDPALAVLADPGSCVRTFGTRDDFLIPSACLNATVSGLVSRTVLTDRLIGPADFHGAKFYAELSAEDVSTTFLDEVSAHFGKVWPVVDRAVREVQEVDRTPTWSGRVAIDEICREFGLPSQHLAKPGVGETTRVLLRRLPWQILVNPERRTDLAHIELLAAERGVPTRVVADLPYSAVGLIRPHEQASR